MGLNVHQNYLKVMVSPFQRSKAQNNSQAELECLERMSAATHCMSDFGLAEETVRGGNQNWGLLPFCSVLAVKCGYHAGGEAGSFLPGYPEFAGWLGKNSSRGRMARILQELGHHINYKISADSSELRLRYIPVIRDFLLNLLSQDSGTTEAINFMDEYGLDRDDVFEKLDEFTMNKKTRKFSDLDSKSKARFTREYNEGVHKSQALVDEQGITKTRKKRKEDRDENASEDINGTESESEEEEISEEQLKKLFKAKKGGRKSSSKKK
jgi:replication factor C subunit 1